MAKKIVLSIASAAFAAWCAFADKCAEDCAKDPAAEDWSRIYLGSVPSISPDGSFFVFEWNGSIWRAPVAGGEATRLTSAESREMHPRVSPDGKRVAFLSNRDGGWKIFEMDLAARETRQVTRRDEFMTLNGWLGDGKTLVAGALRGFGRNGHSSRIVYVSPDGREELPFKNVDSRVAAVSPDGRLVAFCFRGENIYRKRRTGKNSQDGEIWLYDTKTRKFDQARTKAENALSPVWRPDGKAFYYLGRARGASVVAVREYVIDGGKDREVAAFGDDAAFQPTLSADGRTMIVRARFDFWRFDPTDAKSAPERIVVHPGGEPERAAVTRRRYYRAIWNNDYRGDLTFCAGGTQFAFTCGGGLYAMDSIAAKPRLVADAPRGRAVECAFAPDGSRLYALFDFGDSTEIRYYIRKDPSLAWWENTGFDEKTIASGEAPRSSLSVSPDGSRIAWCGECGEMWFADAEGVVTGKGPRAPKAGSYAWSPDGGYVAAALADDNSNFDIWIVSTSGEGEPFNVSRNWRWDGSCAWSPDGKILAWSGYEPEASRATLHYVYLDPADELADKRDEDLERSRKTNVSETGAKDKKDEKKEEAKDAGKKDAGGKNDAAGEKEEKAGKKEEKKAEEKEEKKPEQAEGKSGCKIVFDGLYERVRRTSLPASSIFFSHDSRTVAYDTGGATDKVKLGGALKPERLTSRRGESARWFKDGNCVAWCLDNLPAHLDKKFGISIYREDDVAQWRELAFRTAWARIRDRFYDPAAHGADWKAVREKYLEPARNASSYSVFERVISMMLGELDASHLGFHQTSAAEREWIREPSLHNWRASGGYLGVALESGTFKVASVMRGSPAEGFLAPGDEIAAIDGVPLAPGDCVAERLIVPAGGDGVQISLAGADKDGKPRAPIYVKPVDGATMRALAHEEELRKAREYVHKASGGRAGYIYVNRMQDADYKRFEAEVYAEGCGRDALVIDVRGNGGGYIADRLLAILCQQRHSHAVQRTGQTGYLLGYRTRPFFEGRVVVLIDENSFSNAEIFAHAVKTLKRGTLVGRQTAGAVIATSNAPIFDFGEFRDAHIGWFLLDGRDMENNGAVPDIAVDITPADMEAGRDTQLEAAVRSAVKAAPPAKFKPIYAK